MKKKSCFMFICSIFVCFLASSYVYAFDANCKNITKEKIVKEIAINPFLKIFLKNSKIVNKRKVKGLCEVILSVNNRFFTCYVGKDFTIVGQMYSNGRLVNASILKELKAKKQVQNKELFLQERRNLDKVAAIVYRPSKTAHKVLYMFTDPLCPFCHKAEKKIKYLAKKYNIIVKFIFFSVHGEKSNKKIVEVFCRKFNIDKYLGKKWREEKDIKKFQCPMGYKLLQQSNLIAHKLNIRGVPTFIFEDGTRVIGANMALLENILQKK